MDEVNDMDAVLLAEEVAEQLRVPKSWVYAAARDGRLPCMRMGKHVRFLQSTVDKIKDGARA